MPPEVKERLIFRQDGLVLYRAGLSNDPESSGYPQNFSRDSLEGAQTARDPMMARDQIIFGNLHQAKEADPANGAEPWKYHHQLPGVEVNGGRNSAYCSTDVTADYFMAQAFYQKVTGDDSLTRRFRHNILGAAEVYVPSHINPVTYQFEEDPRYCGAEDFALKRTDWKDSVMPGREDGRGVPPVMYSMIQAQYMSGYRALSWLFGTNEFANEADKMRQGLQALFDKDLGCFYIAQDRLGLIQGVSSDGLNMLIYLEPGDITFDQLEDIILSSMVLETQAGFLNLDPQIAATMTDDYHARVWPKEQANIHDGARKWKKIVEREGPVHLQESLDYVLEVSSRVVRFLDTNTETLKVQNGSVEKAGCDPALWTVTAKQYFQTAEIP